MWPIFPAERRSGTWHTTCFAQCVMTLLQLPSPRFLLLLWLAGCAANVAPPRAGVDAPDVARVGSTDDAPMLGKADSATEVTPVVGPLLSTSWGQGGPYKAATPLKDGERTYPGCTTLASAQVLYYYRFQDHAESDVCYGLEHAPLSGDDVTDGATLCAGLAGERHDWSAMALDLEAATAAEARATTRFIYQVGVTLNAQFGGGEGSSATGKQIENAFRYQWGYSAISRRRMSIISKEAFGFDDAQWAQLMYDELDAGRPVMYMAQQLDADAGHAFVIDGYTTDGRVHVNFGWGGHGNGWYDPNTLEDPSGRRWIRQPMIFRGLEPEEGFAARRAPTPSRPAGHSWGGNGSLISLASEDASGYGLTLDEAHVAADGAAPPAVFFQWEIDGTDGRRLALSAGGIERATITYGVWGERTGDRVHRDVPLPFVLDPSADGLSVADGEYYVVAVTLDGRPGTSTSLVAEATDAPATEATSETATPIVVDGYTWQGNGSVIALASGAREGYGLTTDEARVHTGAERPAVFFQWEVDGRDGRRLALSGSDGLSTATIRYGAWNDRSRDVRRTVRLPYVLDPAADGRSAADGEYYVVMVAFEEAPSATSTVFATAAD